MDIKEEIEFILEELRIAKEGVLLHLGEMSFRLSQEGSNRDDAGAFVQEVGRNEDTLGREGTKSLLAPVALYHKLYVDVGDYGNGEYLVVDENSYYGRRGRLGQWISSSESC